VYNPWRCALHYKDLRDWMFVAYHSAPDTYLNLTTCLKFLAADFGSVRRVHQFLELHQIINVVQRMDASSRPNLNSTAAADVAAAAAAAAAHSHPAAVTDGTSGGAVATTRLAPLHAAVTAVAHG